MKKKKCLIVLLLLFHGLAFARYPQQLTLDSCRVLALKHHPLARQAGLYTHMHQVKDEASGRGYLPQFALSGQASWQSEVTSLPIDIPSLNIPVLPRDNYRVALDINQLIWDGGGIQAQQQLDVSMLQINLTEVETANLQLIERIDQIYFSILLLDEQEKLIKVAMDEVQSRLVKVRAGIANGAVLPTNADVLDAELIGMEQTLTDIRHSRAAAIYTLGAFIGMELELTVVLKMPEYHDFPEFDNWQRPEFKLFGLQQKHLEDQQKLLGIRLMPRFSAFGNVGYGRPGLNMLSDSFEPFAMLGVRLNWNFWDWNITKKNREVLDIQKQIADTQRQTWELNQNVLLNNARQQVLKIENQLAADFRIVALRQSVAKAAASQLDSGVITASDYLTEQNALTKAKLNLSIHKILLQQARLNYLTVMGLAN